MKKNEKRAVLLPAVLLVCGALLAGCAKEAETGRVSRLSASASEIAASAAALPDFEKASFVRSGEPDADLTLMFTYGIEEDAMLDAIDDYALGVQTDPSDPRYFSVIRCKDGTDPAVVQSIASAMEENFAAYIIGQTMRYASEMQSLAEGFTVQLYDNGVVMTAYDTDGNEAVLAAVDAACRASDGAEG